MQILIHLFIMWNPALRSDYDKLKGQFSGSILQVVWMTLDKSF